MVGVIFTLILSLATFLARFGTEDASKRLDAKRNLRRQKLDDLVKQCAQQADTALKAAKTPTAELISLTTHEVNIKNAVTDLLRCCGLTADMRLFVVAFHVGRFADVISAVSMIFFVAMVIPLIIRLLAATGNIDPGVATVGQMMEGLGVLVVAPAFLMLMVVAVIRLVLNEVDKLSVHEVE